ncbi:MAG: phosphomannomutase/phosphoglucomutase [Bacillota bacterium]
MFLPSIFKAYDIRGIVGQDFDAAFAHDLGQAYVALRQRDGLTNKLRIVVARDMRLTSPELCQCLIDGLVASGADVLDAGLLSTPAFYYAVSANEADGGIMVSASHNPKEWNGFKLVREKSKPISGESGIQWLKTCIEEKNFPMGTGSIQSIQGTAAAQLHHDLIHIDVTAIKPFKIVADAANSMGAQYLELLFSRLPAELVKLNFELDGSFPAHEADPLKKENLQQLSNAVIKEQADLGIATDGDGDRVFFVDEKGEVIDPSIIRGLLARIFLAERPGSKICYDVRPGKITVDLIREAGGIPVLSRVGHSLIKEQMISEDAYFAGESSGHFFLNLSIGCFEMPIIMIGKLLAEFSKGDKISNFLKPYRRYSHSGEINRSVKDKAAVFALLEEKYQDAEINRLDGISISYPDFWFNVRASNTEDKVRLNLEALDQATMDKRRDEVLSLIEKA